MQIVKYLDLFAGAVISIAFSLFIIKKVFELKCVKNKKILIICIFISSLIVSIINIFNKDLFKILLTFPITVISIRYVFSINYKKAIIYNIISTIYMFAGEVMTAIIFSLLPFDYTFIFNNILGSTTGNCIVCIFTLPLLYIKPITKLMNKIENSFNENAKIIVTFLLILAIGALGYKNAIGTTNIINIIMNIIILITIVIIVYLYLSETMKTQDLSKNYNELFDYLDKYEKEIVEKRKIIHDYKNQLIIINGYIGDNEKLKEYVKELIDEQKIVSDNSLINNIDKLPRGLKGLIYYKLSHIDKSVKANLSVKTSLKKFDNMSPKLSKEVLKIIGVLLDNAIEAVANEKEKFINIEFSIKKNVFIMIMENYCTEKIDIKNIMEAGYSTKGKDRGYGMALIKDILKKQKNIDLKINIKNSEFVTELEVKI